MGSFLSQFCSCSECCFRGSKTNRTQRTNESIDRNKVNNRVEEQNISYNENKIKNKTSNESKNRTIRKVVIDSNSDQISVISTHLDTDEEESQQILIDEQKLRDELKHSFKGEDDSYGKVIRNKLFPLKEYNNFGTIDRNSNEFSVVKNEMNSRRYRLIESIGSGNWADIYKAYSERQERNVAIKVIDLKQVKCNYGITFVSRGVDHKLNHKNIIKIYETIRTDNKLCSVMQLAANRSVADLITKCGPFTEYMSWLIFVSIVDGLDYMHFKKISHRNLKLENILLTENFIPKISDFCFALIVEQNSLPKSKIYQSLSYFAPEILQQLPYNPFISDVWSLGVCLYIVVNDSLPFKEEDEKEVLEKQLIGDWNFKQTVEPKLSKQLKTFIRFILEPDISLRPTTKQLIKHDWILCEPSPQMYFSANNI